MKRLGLFALAAIFLPVFLLLGAIALPAPASAQDAKYAEWALFDVAFDVQQDGTVQVTETQVFEYFGGPFRNGFSEISTARVEEIENIRVSESADGSTEDYEFVPSDEFEGAPNTYTFARTASGITINWSYPPTTGTTRAFLVSYTLVGAIRVYERDGATRQQLWWVALTGENTTDIRVRKASATVTLPEAVELDAVTIGEGGAGDARDYSSDGKTFSWETTNLGAGESFEPRLEFPAVTAATAPSWQVADDDRRRAAEERKEKWAVWNVIFIAAGLLAIVGGIVGLILVWFVRGRDPHTGLVAEFVATPPDDLPPGIVGTLIDEEAHESDITSTMLDLARRGVISLDYTGTNNPLEIGGGPGLRVTLLQPDAPMMQYERHFLGSFFSLTDPAGSSTTMAEAREDFAAARASIADSLYDALVERGFFTKSPKSTRDNWRALAVLLILAAVALGWIGSSTIGDVAAGFWMPVIALGIVGLALFKMGRALPRKTALGAETAAKWKAFRRYLEDIDQYENLNESKEILDRYLPHAVAFGLERDIVRKFMEAGTAPPAWFPIPVGFPGGRGVYVGGFPGESQRSYQGDGGDSNGPGGGFPDLQDMSDAAGGGLQGTSDSLFDMLNTAAKVFGGGGSSSSGGGWGGGSGGFSGGGSFGGGGGGGGRGVS